MNDRYDIERRAPDNVLRCGMCDWQLLNGEGITRTRPCCPEGLQFDLDHGLTLIGGRWVTTHPVKKEIADNA